MQYVDLGKLPSLNNEKKKRRKRLIKFSVLVVLLSIVLYSGYVLYWPAVTLIKQIAKQPRSVLSLIRNPSGELKSTNGKTNILMIGIDKRANVPYTYRFGQGEVRKNGFLTDTILVMSIDNQSKKVAMVSIPRDLWVSVEPFGKVKASSTKINAVYSIGNVNNYETGGMGLLQKEVQEITGLPIHYGVRIDFDGFRKGVDTLGGLDVVVDKTFDDYQYPIEGKENANCKDGTHNCRFEHLHFNAGLNHMDGATALKYVRSRKGTGGEGSDFARSKRQQKVLIAAKDKALKIENIFDPVKLNNLFKDFGQSVETDLDVSALAGLYNFAKEFNASEINSLVLDNSEGNFLYSPPDGQYGGYVLLPKGGDWSQVKQAVSKLHTSPPPTQ